MIVFSVQNEMDVLILLCTKLTRNCHVVKLVAGKDCHFWRDFCNNLPKMQLFVVRFLTLFAFPVTPKTNHWLVLSIFTLAEFSSSFQSL